VSDTPKSDEALKQWPAYTDEVFSRLENGKRAYGDSSFERPLESLITEIQQELMDVSGWAFIQWHRLESMKEKARVVEACFGSHS
jgi:hypothetical protein